MRLNRNCQAAAVVVLFCVACVGSVSAAQSAEQERLPARPIPLLIIEPVPVSPVIEISQQQMLELERWTRDFAEWQEWAERWLGRRKPGFWTNYVERSKKPDPPAWLAEVCELVGGDEQFARPCELLDSWSEDPIIAKNRKAAAAALIQKEDPTKTVWWQHLHVDGLWSTTQSNISAFGLFGAHFTIKVAGRVQMFAAPGILLVSAPSLYGTRQLFPATDWGISYRLFNVGRSTVHFNLAHAWMFANQGTLVNGNMTLAGFSVSFRPHPR